MFVRMCVCVQVISEVFGGLYLKGLAHFISVDEFIGIELFLVPLLLFMYVCQ